MRVGLVDGKKNRGGACRWSELLLYKKRSLHIIRIHLFVRALPDRAIYACKQQNIFSTPDRKKENPIPACMTNAAGGLVRKETRYNVPLWIQKIHDITLKYSK